MCLSIAVYNPERVLARGTYAGFEFIVAHNTKGYRCGYVRVLAGHPWHGRDHYEIDVDVHGDEFDFGEPDTPCNQPGPDDAYWFGFSFARAGDGRDPAIMPPESYYLMAFEYLDDHVWTQEEVEAECFKVCAQAAVAEYESEDTKEC